MGRSQKRVFETHGHPRATAIQGSTVFDGGDEPARYATDAAPKGGRSSLCLGCCRRRARVRGGHFPFAHTIGGLAGGRRALDRVGASRETYELAPMGPLLYSPYPRRTTVDRVLQSSSPCSFP